MKSIFLSFIIFYPGSVLACNLAPESDWFLPIASIYSKTTQVFVGKIVSIHDLCTTDGPVSRDSIDSKKQFEEKEGKGCYSYSFNVLKKLKGTFKEGDTVQLRSLLKGRAKEALSYNRDCRIAVGFNSSETYVIFLEAFHPDAYRKVESTNSTWVKDIAALKK